MVKELQKLLHESVAAPPADALHLDDVLEGGRRRVRRRWATTAGGAALAAGTVFGAAVLVGGPGLGGGDSAGPAKGTEPVGPELTTADAGNAVAGENFSVLSTTTNENLDRANGRYYRGVTPDGRIVIQDGPHGIDNAATWGLLDPRTDRTDWLPDPGGTPELQPDRFIDTDARWLVFASDPGEAGGFRAFDRRDGRWVEVPVDGAAAGASAEDMALVGGAALGPGNRVYFTLLSVDGASYSSPLLSVSLEDPGDLREEGVVGDFDIDGTELTYTEETNRPSSIVHIRDLVSGAETSFDARSGSRCNALGLRRVEEVITLSQYCGTEDNVRDDRVQVITASGEPIVTLRGNALDGGSLTSRFVTVLSYEDDAAGVYVYDLDSGELDRVSEGAPKFGGSMTGYGDLLTWATPINDRHGMKIWAVEFE
jgi:hypothetical protein